MFSTDGVHKWSCIWSQKVRRTHASHAIKVGKQSYVACKNFSPCLKAWSCLHGQTTTTTREEKDILFFSLFQWKQPNLRENIYITLNRWELYIVRRKESIKFKFSALRRAKSICIRLSRKGGQAQASVSKLALIRREPQGWIQVIIKYFKNTLKTNNWKAKKLIWRQK